MRNPIFDPYRIVKKFGTGDYVGDRYPYSNFSRPTNPPTWRGASAQMRKT